MKKPDASVHKICIAAIVRHTMTPYEFKWTRFFKNTNTANLEVFIAVVLEEAELPICACFVSDTKWTLLTTRRVISSEESNRYEQRIENIQGRYIGNFKGYGNLALSRGEVEAKTGDRGPYFIETGKASMVMIYGIDTILKLVPMSNEDIAVTETRYRKSGMIEE